MKNQQHIVYGALALMVGIGTGFYFGKKSDEQPLITQSAQWPLCHRLAHLWADHVVWDRNYTIAALAGTSDLDAALNRLLKNQEDLGDVFGPYYGTAFGKQLTSLLKEHISLSGKSVEAMKVHDYEAFKKADKGLHHNADALAKHFSQVNSAWSESELRKMLYKHISLKNNQTTLRVKKAWHADIKNADRVYEQAMDMARTFFEGIVNQFPEKF